MGMEILSGDLLPGSPISTVRSLAGRFCANPNTVQRAIEELRRMGLLTSSRGKHTAVTADEFLISRLRKECSEELTQFFFREVKALGYSYAQIQKMTLAQMDTYGQAE